MKKKQKFGFCLRVGICLLAVCILFSGGSGVFAHSEDITCFAQDHVYRCLEAANLPTGKTQNSMQVLLGGMPFGVKLQTLGVMVIGVSEVETPNGKKNPAYEGGIRTGDVILRINGNEVNSVEEVTNAVSQCEGRTLTFTIMHGGSEYERQITPVETGNGGYKTGLWVRDTTAGIGTVTFVDPQSGAFAGLGHGICDAETGELVTFSRGAILDVTITGVIKGAVGRPGELKGYLNATKTGTLLANQKTGVYGMFAKPPQTTGSDFLPIATSQDIHEGDAVIYSTVNASGEVKAYQVRICHLNEGSGNKNFVIEVKDPALLEITGGIVQGMSGSPVVQNGKLIGAVTHVLINDPTKGYGITIGNMLSNMPQLLK